MADTRPKPISIDKAIAALTFLPDRTPSTTPEESAGSFSELSAYRDGGVFVGHWAGNSEWERHPGDEIVVVTSGETTIVLLEDDVERSSQMGTGDLLVVPSGTWHRFETPNGVKLLSVTPQPTDHQTDRPT